MCIKNIFYNVYADGEEDVTESLDTCRPGSDQTCADPTVREYDRRFHCSRQDLSASPGAKRPLEVTVSIENKSLRSQRVPIPMPKAPRAGSRTSVAVPIHPTPENYIFQSYSDSKPEIGPPEAIMESPDISESRNQVVPHSGVQSPPSQPGMSSEGSNKSGMLGQLQRVEDHDILDFSSLPQHDNEIVRRVKQASGSNTGGGWGTLVLPVPARLRQTKALRETEEERKMTEDIANKEIRRLHERLPSEEQVVTRQMEERRRIVRDSPSRFLQQASEDQRGDTLSYAGLTQSSASPFNNKLAMETTDFTKDFGPVVTPTRQSHTLLFTGGSVVEIDASSDDIPVGIDSEVHSGHSSDPHDTNTNVPARSTTFFEANNGTRSGVSVVGMSEADDTSSIQSYKDSIFDDLESVTSSASSLGDNVQVEFVGIFVDLLIRDPSVDRMISRATSDEGIGVERFRRSFSRILKAYSRDLRDTIAQYEQQKEHNHQRVVAFISRKAIQASGLIATRYEKRAPKPDRSAVGRVEQYLEGLEWANSDSSDEEEVVTEPAVAGLENFLLQGKPFRALKWHLRSLIISNQRVAQVKESAENLLSFLFCNLGLEETFAGAFRRVCDFSTWLRLKIDSLAASLETELKAESPMTEYLSIYSEYLSVRAVQRLIQKPHVSGTQHPEESPRREPGKVCTAEIRPPEEILEDIMAIRLPEVFGGEFSEPNAWARLSSTKSFRGFASELSDAAYPTFFSESRKVLKAELDSKDHRLSNQSEERYLLSILVEVQHSARQDRGFPLLIQAHDSVRWLDRLKLSIEKSTGSEWSWWPLSPPPRAELPAHVKLEPLALRQRLLRAAMWLVVVLLYTASSATELTRQHMPPQGCSRSIRSHEEHADCAKVISWLCKCGCTRRELVSPKYANLFQRLASEYPMAHCNNDPIQSTGLYAPRPSCKNSSGSSSSSTDTPSASSSDSTGDGSSRASVSTAPSSTGSTAITVDFDRQTFVHLLVRKGDQYVLSPMKVTEGDARGFFQDLIVRYQQRRGFLRRLLSIFVYSHCDFVKVKHHRAYRFSPISGFSFPERLKDVEFQEYTYNPEPMIQAPITKHMFNDYFYSCYNNNNMKHSILHKFLSSCDVIETLPQDLLESMPKRDREVMVGAQFGRVEHFWGIVAREQRSALRVVLYMLLSLMPTVWFMFMWMFSWGHEGDLQNATVPVTISLATLSMTWIVVYSGGESGNE